MKINAQTRLSLANSHQRRLSAVRGDMNDAFQDDRGEYQDDNIRRRLSQRQKRIVQSLIDMDRDVISSFYLQENGVVRVTILMHSEIAAHDAPIRNLVDDGKFVQMRGYRDICFGFIKP